jgi:hypothetical protein
MAHSFRRDKKTSSGLRDLFYVPSHAHVDKGTAVSNSTAADMQAKIMEVAAGVSLGDRKRYSITDRLLQTRSWDSSARIVTRLNDRETGV